MMPLEDIQIQLVDLPPVTRDGLVPGMLGTVRSADGILLVKHQVSQTGGQVSAVLEFAQGLAVACGGAGAGVAH